MELTVCFQFRYNLWSNSSKSSVKMFVILRKMGKLRKICQRKSKIISRKTLFEKGICAMKLRVNRKSDSEYWLDLILMFFVISAIGWIWEVFLIWFLSGNLGDRGFLHGPWLPIYGCGGILMIWMKEHLPNKRWVFFLSCIGVAGVLEYATSWILEYVYHTRWWDYSSEPLNLNGRICVSNLLLFGIAGLFLVYFLYPKLKKLFAQLPRKCKIAVDTVLSTMFCIDAVWSMYSPNAIL